MLDFDVATFLLLHAGKWRAVFIQLSSASADLQYVHRSSRKLQWLAPLIAPEHDSSRIKGSKYSALLLCGNVFQSSDMRRQHLACDKSSGCQFSSDYPGIVEPVQIIWCKCKVKISVQLDRSPAHGDAGITCVNMLMPCVPAECTGAGGLKSSAASKVEIRAVALVWTAKRGNKGEEDIHLGAVY